MSLLGKKVRKFKINDRITVPFVGGSDKCEYCKEGNHQVCDHQFQPGFTHWGSFAKYVSINYADVNLIKLPNEIDFVTAASLGCRFATSFREVVDQAKVKEHQWIAVHGCGGVGLSAIMIAVALGAKVITIDVNLKALKLAKSLGAIITINSSNTNHIIEDILEITKGGIHTSIDAFGNPEILLNSVSSLLKKGKHIHVGIMNPKFNLPQIPIDLIIARELEIIGSHGIQAHRYDEMLKMISLGKLRPEKLITNKIFLSEAIELLPKMNLFKNDGITIIDKFY